MKLFAAPKGIVPAVNRKEKRTRAAIARKQVNKRSFRK